VSLSFTICFNPTFCSENFAEGEKLEKEILENLRKVK